MEHCVPGVRCAATKKFETFTFDLYVAIEQQDVYDHDMFCVRVAVNCAGQFVTEVLFF